MRGAAGGAAGGAARGAAGTVPEQRAQGALRPARAQRADSRMQNESKEKNPKANAARHDDETQTRRAWAPHGV